MRASAIGFLILVGCGGGSSSKPGTAKVPEPTEEEAPAAAQLTVDLAGGGTDATDYEQRVGPNATSATMWEEAGPDADGVTCDESTEGLGWCLDDSRLYACSGGMWRSTPCLELFEDGACGVTRSSEGRGGAVDCGHRGEMLADPMEDPAYFDE